MKKISAEEYWKWDKFEGETSAEDMKEDFKRYVKEHYGKNIEFVESDNPDTFKALFQTVEAVPLSVIEDIKAFIAKDIIFYDLTERDKLNEFIDRKIAEVTKNER